MTGSITDIINSFPNYFNLLISKFSLYSFVITVFAFVILSASFVLRLLKINGAVIFTGAFGLFIYSSLKSNFFLQFLTSSLLLYLLIIFIYYLSLIIIYKSEKIQFNSLSVQLVHPFQAVRIKITGDNFPLNYPGTFSLIECDVRESNQLYNQISSFLEPVNKNELVFHQTFIKHGDYLLNHFQIVFTDIAGFTKYRQPVQFDMQLKVYPYFKDALSIPFFLDSGGEEILQSLTRINSTDFFENRKYYPGDDTRRINWKVFAHSGELHIREVEKIPPMMGQVTILYAPYSENPYEYEFICSLFLSTVHYLLKNNFQLKIITPDNEYIIDKDKENIFEKIIFTSRNSMIHHILTLKQVVLFTSLQEYESLLGHHQITDSYCAISAYKEKEKTLSNYLLKVVKFDNFIMDIKQFYHIRQKNKKRKKLIEKVRTKSFQNQNELKLFWINKNDFKT